MKYLLTLSILLLTACGARPESSEIRHVQRAWTEVPSKNKLDLTAVDTTGQTASMLLFTYNVGTTFPVQCWMTAFFRGDDRSGTITLENPGLLVVKPNFASNGPCTWIADVVGYEVVGEQLTITLSDGQEPYRFK